MCKASPPTPEVRQNPFFFPNIKHQGLYLHLARRMAWKPILRATRLTYTLRSRIRTVRDSPRFPLPDRSYHIMLALVTLYLTDQPTMFVADFSWRRADTYPTLIGFLFTKLFSHR